MTDYSPRHLVKISPNANNNKYYDMTPCGSGWEASYGRVGASPQRRSYSFREWDKKYNEKLNKGYVDRTELVADLITKVPVADEYKPISDAAIADIVNRLRKMARQAVADNYSVSSDKVTMAMVDEAQALLNELVDARDINKFNTLLAELFGVIPRRMKTVRSHLAKSDEQFGEIIRREQDLLDVMRGQVFIPKPAEEITVPVGTQTVLEANGLVFEPVADEDVVKIKACLGSCADKFSRAWRVSNVRTQKAFDDYVTPDHIATKLFWHGSRNENWWSIINAGLVLKPTNAVITGKMFGYGIYFANKARKSLGYTSLSGSYWAKGSEQTAFMGLYEVAYGKPYDVYAFHNNLSSLDYAGLQRLCPGANCLHAHEGKMLRNDEIIVYQECQTTIRYLVEIKH